MAIQDQIDRITDEVSTQTNLIAQIVSALNGKVAGGGSSSDGGSSNAGVSIVTGTFTHTEETGDEPGTSNYVLASDSLQSSIRSVIVVFTQADNEYSCVWKVFHRTSLSDSFESYNGTNDYITHGMDFTFDESTITVSSASTTDSAFYSFWFIAV